MAEEVSSKWGGQTYLAAPVLCLPADICSGGSQYKWCYIAPGSVRIECEIIPEIRRRSIYEVLLYRTKIRMMGSFRVPDFDKSIVKEADVSKAELRFFLRSAKGISGIASSFNYNNLSMGASTDSMFSFNVSTDEGTALAGEIPFTAEIELKGYQKIMFLPNADVMELVMKSAWPHPSFCGGDLPAERDISSDGFTAKWKINSIMTRQTSKYWRYAESKESEFTNNISLSGDSFETLDSCCIGVTLVKPADTYAQIKRVTDYAFVLIAVLLIAFLCGEKLVGIWVHPFQYLFVGLSMAMFYLLLLALAEHVNFNLSYLISAVVISGMTTAYCRMIFSRKSGTAFVLGGVMLVAYAFIYFLTRLEDCALLMGAMVLLVLLGVLMAFTGHLNQGKPSSEADIFNGNNSAGNM